MKKTLFLIVLFYSQLVFAQTNMNIYLNNGTLLQIPITSIDSITYYNSNFGSLATIITSNVVSIGANTALCGGDVTNNGGSPVSGRGVCWNTSPNPTTLNYSSYDGNGNGVFTSVLSGLAPNTVYYVRAYAINSAGTSYGNEQVFTTMANTGVGACAGGPNIVTDFDGNNYNVISIGTQCWMKENLKVTHYRNGVSITGGLSDAQWINTSIGAYGDYNNDTLISNVYGKLYNWYAVIDSNGLCPTGWHIPQDSEWNILVKFLDPNADTTCVSCIPSSLAGGAMKETGLLHWASPNLGATNSSGFTGLPNGGRDASNGSYYGLGNQGNWWSSTLYNTNAVYIRNIQMNSSNINRSNFYKKTGLSVRCVRD